MMTLDEAIIHCKEKAQGDCACAEDHRQLAAWLEELREFRESDSCNANENAACYMIDEDALKDRKRFVHNLGELLSQTREGILRCELIEGETEHERVCVYYRGGHREVSTHQDSYLAIVRDVTKHI